MQNQIDYYRARGYQTVFICVPIHCSYTESHSDWDSIKIGIQELGADQTFFRYDRQPPVRHREVHGVG